MENNSLDLSWHAWHKSFVFLWRGWGDPCNIGMARTVPKGLNHAILVSAGTPQGRVKPSCRPERSTDFKASQEVAVVISIYRVNRKEPKKMRGAGRFARGWEMGNGKEKGDGCQEFLLTLFLLPACGRQKYCTLVKKIQASKMSCWLW